MSGTYNDSLTDVSSDSFWEVGNYKRTVRRVDDGNRLCNDLMNCIHERARIEKAYAQQLTEWAKRWRQLIDKGPQYGTLENAWTALMSEAEKVSDLHMEVKSSLMGEDFEKVKNWQKDAYHKQMIGGFKETKEAEDGFRKAQKPWAKKLKEVDTMKKAYHAACKEEKLATSRENNSKLESNSNPDTQKKLQEKVEKCQQDVEKTKERYEKSLEELDKVTPPYMENMDQMFEQWQEFEEKRISFFKELLLDVKKHIDLSSNHKFQTVYHTLEDTIQAADAVEDLKWFSANHGPGMHMNWPQFEKMETPRTRLSTGTGRLSKRRSIRAWKGLAAERGSVLTLGPFLKEWSIDMNRTLSRRDRKKPGEGVMLTGISQTGDQPAKSSSSLSVPASTEPAGFNPFEDDEEEEETAREQPNSSPTVTVKKDQVHTQTLSVPPSTEPAGSNPFEEDEDEEESPQEQPNSSPTVTVKKDQVPTKTASSVDKTQDWSDEEVGNPFSADSNGNSNPFEDEPSPPAVSVPVKALYDYEGQEQDELSFKAGEEFIKIGEEDDQGWCRGRLKDGTTGLYPANYVEDDK